MNIAISLALFKGRLIEIKTIIHELHLDDKINKEFLSHLDILNQHFTWNARFHGGPKAEPIHIPKKFKESSLDKIYKKILEGEGHEKERRIIYQKAVKARGMADLLMPHLCGYELQKRKKTQIKKVTQRNKAA